MAKKEAPGAEEWKGEAVDPANEVSAKDDVSDKDDKIIFLGYENEENLKTMPDSEDQSPLITIDIQGRVKQVFGFSIAQHLHEVIVVRIANVKQGLKMKLTKHGMMMSHHQDYNLRFADIILGVNDESISDRNTFVRIYQKALKQTDQKPISITVLRLKFHLPMDSKRLPIGYEMPTSMKFEHFVAVLYRIPYVKLSLSIKSYLYKVFVTDAPADTLAGLTFSQGDVIIDVEGQMMDSVPKTSKLIMENMKKKGIVSMLVERPIDDAAFQYCRMVMHHNKTQCIDTELPKDVREICREHRKALRSSDFPLPSRSIIREKTPRKSKRVQISKYCTEVPIDVTGNPKLLGRVTRDGTAVLLQSNLTSPSESSSLGDNSNESRTASVHQQKKSGSPLIKVLKGSIRKKGNGSNRKSLEKKLSKEDSIQTMVKKEEKTRDPLVSQRRLKDKTKSKDDRTKSKDDSQRRPKGKEEKVGNKKKVNDTEPKKKRNK